MPTARVRVLRPACFDGIAQPAGAVIPLQLEDALLAVEGGRCEFVDERDRERCMDARRKSIHGMLRRVPAVAEPQQWRPLY